MVGLCCEGTWWHSWVRHCATSRKVTVLFPIVSLESFVDVILPAALWPWGRLSLNRNEFQEYFLGAKGGRCVGQSTLAPSCADCLGIWEPQPLGILSTCVRIAFNFVFV